MDDKEFLSELENSTSGSVLFISSPTLTRGDHKVFPFLAVRAIVYWPRDWTVWLTRVGILAQHQISGNSASPSPTPNFTPQSKSSIGTTPFTPHLEVTIPKINDPTAQTIEDDSHAANTNDNFQLLAWWKENSPRYPILSRIARDVFAVPASTVASESAFSLGKRIVDPFRSSLTPKMVEAFVCMSDWLRAGGFSFYKELTKAELELYDELEKLESGIISFCISA